jgi:hypothetical protein
MFFFGAEIGLHGLFLKKGSSWRGHGSLQHAVFVMSGHSGAPPVARAVAIF